MTELKCLCGSLGGTPIWKRCQGRAEHKRKVTINAAMKKMFDNLHLLKLKPSECTIIRLDSHKNK